MADTANLDGVAIAVYKEEAIVADAEPKLVSAPQGLEIARTGFGETM
jgi:hypothetical protein